ncbi:Elongation factor 1-alpha [Pseudocercospora fuligena]|uniref:Elongation factor 1-alpha n=1 Tax=Pseudocercospora fuligena TaxID=685502 RepID=A0A8H6RJ72_9PEZI|nr:Elongation factor 1-alpha [Pseudocercospora fuligena]
MPGSKKVHISGISDDDVASLIGSLVYKLGLDMRTLEALEKANSNFYAQIPQYLAEKNLRPCFYTKENLCDVTWLSSAGRLGGSKLVVLVGKMEQIEWSSSEYKELLRTIQTHLHDENLAGVSFIPISISDGGNLLEPSERTAFFESRIKFGAKVEGPRSVIEAIDA